MRRLIPFLATLLLIAVQTTTHAQTMIRLVFNYTGQTFGGKVLGTGPVTSDHRITVSLTLDVPNLNVNITTRDRTGAMTAATPRGQLPAITSRSNGNAYLRAWRMSDGVHVANEQNAVLGIDSFKADVTPDGQIRFIHAEITAHSFDAERLLGRQGPPSFTLSTGGSVTDRSSSNYPNGGNLAAQSGMGSRTGKWTVSISPTNQPITSTGAPLTGSSNPVTRTDPGPFRSIPPGSRFVFRGTKVFFQDSTGRLTVPPDGKYRPFNNNYIMTVRGGEKFTSNN